IDEIQPEQKFETVVPSINIQDYGKDLEEIVGTQSTVAIGSFLKIPLSQILNFFSRVVHGPKLQGGLHLDGDKLILTAQLKGGKFNGSWNVCSDELEELPLPSSDTGKIVKMIEILVYKIFAYLGRSGSPRWKAVMYYTRGLKLYRDSVRQKEQEQLNLIKAKDAFSLSIRDDSEFVQCYYNLGIIYRGLKSEDAAEAAFRKALEVESDNYHCYYQLARIYYIKRDYSHAQWFCEQALAICPKDPEHWNLWAYIQYKIWFKTNTDNHESALGIPREVIEYRLNATMLAWRALCKAIVKGEKIQKYEQTARICLRHLAKASGKRLWRKSRRLFRQAFFLEPDNNDLFFELGKYFYRQGKAKKSKKYFLQAYDAFTRVFEDDIAIGDPCSFWTFDLSVNAELFEFTKKKLYREGVEQSYHHFLECAGKEIHIIGAEPENKEDEINKAKMEAKLKENKTRIAAALNKIGAYDQANQIDFIDDLLTFSKEIKDALDIAEILVKENKRMDALALLFPAGVEVNRNWPTAQIKIISAKRLLEIGQNDEIEQALRRLEDAIKIFKLREENPYELKILELYLYLALGHFKKRNYAQALIWAREAVKLDPYEPKIRQLLVEIHFALKEYSRGLDESAISLNLRAQQNLDIIKKIGNAYKEKVKIQDDPELSKKFLDKAVNYFDQALKIMEDKSFPVATATKNAQEYMENLGEIHFYLGLFLFKQKKYNAAKGHFQSVREMGYKNRQNMVKLGWEYLEEKFFNEAEQAFNEAGADEMNKINEPDVKSREDLAAQIKLGLAAAFIERGAGFHSEDLREKPLSLLKDAENSIAAVPGQDKNQLEALFHRWQGLFYFKIEKYEEALPEFEKAILLMASPAVYYHLAETHRRLAEDQEAANRKIHLRSARSACMLCLKNDPQKQYETAVTELLKQLDDLK
ncbi:MAG TPA: tetratricopeptide repeat protein, partial [Candidatus Deferrimicrobium sp.]|nr:tetratricopeptide repeat protein [Candidatus Deferrimicrobium sp.]